LRHFLGPDLNIQRHPTFLNLHQCANELQSAAMKFLYALIVWFAMLAVITAGIVLAVVGKPWLMIISLVAFIVAVGKIGCAVHS
jgi:hypothetical protein